MVANVHVSWLDPCKVRRVTMVGSQKMVVFDDLAAEERIRVHNKGVAQPETEGDLTQAPMSYRYGDVVSPYLVFNEPLSIEDEHFTDCILTGMRPLTDGENGLAVVEVLEAATAVRPAATGRGPLRGARGASTSPSSRSRARRTGRPPGRCCEPAASRRPPRRCPSSTCPG